MTDPGTGRKCPCGARLRSRRFKTCRVCRLVERIKGASFRARHRSDGKQTEPEAVALTGA